MQQLQEDYMQNQNRQQNKYSVNRILSCFSILLIMLCYLLISTILYSFIFDTTMQYHLVYSNTCFTIIILSLGIALGQYLNQLGFNVMINYTFAIFVSPGTTNDYFIPRQNDTENSENQIENNANQNLRYLKFNYTIKLTQNIPSPSIVLDQSTLRFCNYCQLPKPQRSHHCSICNKCVLKMDHHCPWINNCVGHLNHRYFILFLTYIFFGTFYINLLNINIQFSTQFQEFKNQQSYLFSTIWIIDLGLFWTIACFGSWNWFLILRGYTVIEFSERNTKTTYEKGEIKDNLKQVFGDFKYIFEIFMPNFKKLPSNGVIWNQIDKNLEKINMSVD